MSTDRDVAYLRKWAQLTESAGCPLSAAAYRDAATELEQLQQTALNGAECSKCLRKATEPICMYCDECYGGLVAENERLRAIVAKCHDGLDDYWSTLPDNADVTKACREAAEAAGRKSQA